MTRSQRPSPSAVVLGRLLPQRTMKGRPLAPRTVQTYRHSLEAWILPALGEVRLVDLTPFLIRTWHAGVSRRTGPTALRQVYATLRAILNTAVSDEALVRNPCKITGAGQSSSPERRLRSLDEVEALIDAMPAHLRVLVTVAFGARCDLARSLRSSDATSTCVVAPLP